ncbi:hypothetical protein JZ751_014255 [Albula glossodonta]|uniref:Uncharacterized protein n=1 Tax=Albula glossodonta TaxID=121402 RepID=A0A8T2NSY3_9TELE|nr:hypothetical protein JZ751_014255 [Albula glossodonta]
MNPILAGGGQTVAVGHQAWKKNRRSHGYQEYRLVYIFEETPVLPVGMMLRLVYDVPGSLSIRAVT